MNIIVISLEFNIVFEEVSIFDLFERIFKFTYLKESY